MFSTCHAHVSEILLVFVKVFTRTVTTIVTTITVEGGTYEKCSKNRDHNMHSWKLVIYL